MDIGRRNVEGGGRVATFANNSFRTVLGLKGDITDGWTFDAYAQRETVDTNLGQQNYFDASRVANALNVVPGPGGVPTCASVIAGTDTTCVPWNIWVPNGVTAAALNYLQIPLLVQATTTEEVASGSVTGDLTRYGIKLPTAEDGLIINLGAEWRSESADFLPDVASQLGNAEGSGGPTVPVDGGFTVREAFTEVSLPLAQHLPFAESLAFNGGYRFSSYSEGFKTNTYKFAVDYEPFHDIRARASYQRAVRAPNVNELFLPQSVQLDGSTDPCAGAAPAATQAQCVLAGVSAAQYTHIGANSAAQYNGFLGGNPDLKPETSDTYSAGVIIQPSMVPNLTLSVDYFDIEIKNVIGAIGADTILQNCIATGSPTYCDAIHRDANGSLFRTQQGYVSDTNVNFGKLSTRGLDVKAAYRTPIPAIGSISSLGSLAFQLEGTRLISLNTEPLTDGPSYNCTGLFGVTCGAPNPAWRHVFTTTWSTPWDALDITLRWRYLGSASSQLGSNDPQLSGVPLPLTEHIPAYNYLDLTARFAIYKGVSLQLGVNNIADKDPPVVSAGGGGFGSDCPTITPNGSSCNGNTFPGTYDSLGRFLFAHVTAQF
jgi:outer membrane receptor protein involved in Fe transport